MKLQAPNLPNNPITTSNLRELLEEAHILDGAVYNARVKKAVYCETGAEGVSFKNVIFEGCNFTGCPLKGASFYDCSFSSCNFSNAGLNGSYFSRCEIKSCKAVGANLRECRMNDVSISDSNLSFVNFDESKMQGVIVRDSDFNSATFTQCKLKNTVFDNNQFVRTSFFKTPLKGIDLRTCELSGLIVSIECTELKGAVVTMFQAAELSRLMGLVIK